MGVSAASDALEAHLSANFTLAPVTWGNDGFEKPLSGDGSPLPWVAAAIEASAYGQESIGAFPASDNRWDADGWLYLFIHVASGSGRATLKTLTDVLMELFRGTTLLGGNLDFPGKISADNGGPAEHDGAYYMRTISVPWRLAEA